ncbi:MAG: hypothetical protein ACE5PO_01260, partial [Candidatus Bathyarchaeia archaeon]
TAGYTTPTGRSIVDAKSAQVVLETLTKMLDVSINLTPLDAQAKYTEDFLRKLEEMERSVLEEAAKKSAPKDKQYYI